MINISRRNFLGGSAAALALSAAPSISGATTRPLSELVLWGPPVGPSIALAHIERSGNSREFVENLTFRVWRTPDQLRAGIVSGGMQVSGVPSYVGANLYNKGMPVQMLNIMTWGLLYMMSSDGSIGKIEDIVGKTVTMPFKNDMPDLVFQFIAEKAGLKIGKDFTVQYASTPLEVVQMMTVGKADTAILPEPAASASLLSGKMNSLNVHRVLNIQEEWGKATGGPARIPQAGLLVNKQLVEKHTDILKVLQADCVRSCQWVVNNPTDSALLAEDYIGVKAPIAELSMPFTNLETTSATDAREEMEDFFSKLAELSPKIIGGKLPAADFYLAL